MTNQQVIDAFLDGREGHSLNLSTDGKILKSYHYYPIGWWEEGMVALRNTRNGLYSMTTTKHFNMLISAAKNQHYTFFSTLEVLE